MVKVLGRDEPLLRKIAVEVPVKEIQTAKIRKIIADMKRALTREPDGVAIAAPQIDVPLRIFVVSGKMLRSNHKAYVGRDIVVINPKITKLSKEKKYMEEGCLSVRYLYGKVKRSSKIQIEGYDEKGKFFKRGASGLLAQVFQHETDHLEGILFTDKAKDVQEIPPEVWEQELGRKDWPSK
ncbi:peptide deformylase [Patescibacteria group bacterium]|nr:MAG: peptide deformylase [Patescibacteria group bacterium]